MNLPEDVASLLGKYGQDHLVQFWDEISEDQQKKLLLEIDGIDFKRMDHLYQDLANPESSLDENQLSPLSFMPQSSDDWQHQSTWVNMAHQAMQKGEIAALLVAGGQGSRLGYDGPKGMFNIELPSQKSLFQLQAERLLRLQRLNDCAIPWYIMTSELNDQETRAFFESNKFFGLNSEDVFFFSQGQIPAIDTNGKILLSSKSEIALVPDGNGGVFQALKHSGALADMQARNIKSIFLYGVDNALTPICAPTLMGYHLWKGGLCTSPVVRKEYAEEKVGVFVNSPAGPCVAEYSDISDEMRHRKTNENRLYFDGANLAIHILQVELLEKVSDEPLPYHRAFKSIPFVNSNGNVQEPEKENAWKFEQFMFDIFPLAGSMEAIEVIRASCFAPVKNADGKDSPESARNLILDLHTTWLKEASLIEPNDSKRYEISPLLSMNGENLAGKNLQVLKDEQLILVEK